MGTDWRPRGGSRRAWSWPRAGISSKYLAILVPNWALLGLPMRWLVVSWASGLAAPALGPAQGGLQTGSLRLRKAPGLAASAQVSVRAGLQTGSLWLRWKSSLSVEARIPARGVLKKGCHAFCSERFSKSPGPALSILIADPRGPESLHVLNGFSKCRLVAHSVYVFTKDALQMQLDASLSP